MTNFAFFQIVQDNPELLNQLADQFQRLQEILNVRRGVARNQNGILPVGTVQSNNIDPDSQIPSPSQQALPRLSQSHGLPALLSRSQSTNVARNSDANTSVVLNMEFENVAPNAIQAQNQSTCLFQFR